MKVRPHLGFIGIGEDNMKFRTSWIGGMYGDKDEEQDAGISVFPIRWKKAMIDAHVPDIELPLDQYLEIFHYCSAQCMGTILVVYKKLKRELL
jgi:hypothetical protein